MMDEERLIEAAALPDDPEFDVALRPRTLEEFVGQERVKEQLALLIDGARQRGEPVDHLLFSGPPGLGKTTLGQIVANEMGAGFQPTSGPALDRPSDLAAILTNLDDGDVLFVDEIHRMPRTVEEVLYPALEDFNLDVVLGKGPTARSIRLELPRFTLIGATTRPGRITLPLRERFGFSPRLDYYPVDDLGRIVRRSAGILGVQTDADGADEIAKRSRGTPRIANRLLRRVRDFAEVRHDGAITGDLARAGSGAVRGRRAGSGSSRPQRAAGRRGEVRRRPGGALDPRGRGRRGARHRGRRRGAVPDAAGVPEADAAGARRHRAGVPPSGRQHAGHLAPLAAAFRRFGRSEGRLRGRFPNDPASISPHTKGPRAMTDLIAATTNTSSNPLTLFLPLILMGGVFYFLLIRPQQKRVRAQQALVNAVEVGDEIMTTGGIFGTIAEMDDDEGTVLVEIAPGTQIRMVKSGISRRLTVDDDEYEPEDEDQDQDQQFS